VRAEKLNILLEVIIKRRMHTKAKNVADEVFELLVQLGDIKISGVVMGRDGDANRRGTCDITNYMVVGIGLSLHDVHKKVTQRIDVDMSSDARCPSTQTSFIRRW